MSPLRTFILYPSKLRFCSHILHNYKRRQRKRKKSEQGRVRKTTTLHVQQSFWYISSPSSLYDHDVKMPTSPWPDWETTKFSFSFWTSTLSLGIQLEKGSLACRVFRDWNDVNSRFRAKFSPRSLSWYLKLAIVMFSAVYKGWGTVCENIDELTIAYVRTEASNARWKSICAYKLIVNIACEGRYSRSSSCDNSSSQSFNLNCETPFEKLW